MNGARFRCLSRERQSGDNRRTNCCTGPPAWTAGPASLHSSGVPVAHFAASPEPRRGCRMPDSLVLFLPTAWVIQAFLGFIDRIIWLASWVSRSPDLEGRRGAPVGRCLPAA